MPGLPKDPKLKSSVILGFLPDSKGRFKAVLSPPGSLSMKFVGTYKSPATALLKAFKIAESKGYKGDFLFYNFKTGRAKKLNIYTMSPSEIADKLGLRGKERRDVKRLIMKLRKDLAEDGKIDSNKRVLKIVKKRTGKIKNIKMDRKRKALPPGWRVSRTGNIYRETRKNRSDLKGRV